MLSDRSGRGTTVGASRAVRVVLWVLLAVLASAFVAGGAEPEPVKRELQLIYVFEGAKPEFLFVIGQSGFKSVASLRRHLETWPPGSELRWAPGCVRVGGEPLLSSEEEMGNFRKFLERRGIRFVLVPSG